MPRLNAYLWTRYPVGTYVRHSMLEDDPRHIGKIVDYPTDPYMASAVFVCRYDGFQRPQTYAWSLEFVVPYTPAGQSVHKLRIGVTIQ